MGMRFLLHLEHITDDETYVYELYKYIIPQDHILYLKTHADELCL